MRVGHGLGLQGAGVFLKCLGRHIGAWDQRSVCSLERFAVAVGRKEKNLEEPF